MPAVLGAVVRRVLALAMLLAGAPLVVAAGVTAVATPAAHADAGATGVGGMFVPAFATLMDTRNGAGVEGYTTPMPSGGSWRTVTVGGVGGIPTTGVSAVQITLTAINPTGQGVASVRPDGGSDADVYSALVYDSGVTGTVSNTVTVAVGSDGKIAVAAQTQTDMAIQVQGYYTTSTGQGYVPITPVTAIDSRSHIGIPASPVPANMPYTVWLNSSGIPSTATAVVVNFQILSYSGSGGYLNAWPTDGCCSSSLSFPGGQITALGAVVQVSGDGTARMNIRWSGSGTADIVMTVVGFFAGALGGTSAGGGMLSQAGMFTPGAARVATQITVPSNSAVNVQTTGVAGVPLAGSGIGSVTANLQVINGASAQGTVYVAPSDRTNTYVGAVVYAPGSIVSNMTTVPLGADGAISVYNQGPNPVQVTMDVEGWYFSATGAVPSAQSSTQKSIGLQGSVYGGPWVTYKYRTGNNTNATLTAVPVAQVSDANGNHPSAWPVTTSGSPAAYTAYTWDMSQALGSASAGKTLVQLFACYGTSSTDSNPVCSAPFNVSYVPSAFGANHATASVGPGSLSLLTGDFEIGGTDASVPSVLGGISVGKTLTTLTPAAGNTGSSSTPTGVFGPGWTADLVGPDAGEADQTVIDNHQVGYLTLTGPDAATITMAATGPVPAWAPNTWQMTFLPSGDDANSGMSAVMAYNSGSNGTDAIVPVGDMYLKVSDPDGTVTTWISNNSGPAAIWQVAAVTPATSSSATGASAPGRATFVYGTSGAAAGLVTRILGPTPEGQATACTDANAATQAGCRSLVLNYGTPTGTSVTRLMSIDEVIGAGSPAVTTVAAYDYDSNGLLVDSYDPRISPNLKTTYSYAASGSGPAATTRLATLTPPHQNAWSFNYDSSGRLASATRTMPVTNPTNPSAPTTDQSATTTIVYNVPNSLTGLPTMTAGTNGTMTGWGETADLPVDKSATAIFAPDSKPANASPTGTQVSDIGTGEWAAATIHYLDVNGREVNTAVTGAASGGTGQWLIDTNQYDVRGNNIWHLSAGNQAQALNPTADTDPYVSGLTDTAKRADALAEKAIYNSLDPSEVTDTFGPTHPVTLVNGTKIDARTHVSTTYDENAPHSDVDPKTGQAYRLPTTVVTSNYQPATGTDTTGADATTTTTGYGAVGSMSGDGGWALHQATTSTIKMQGNGPDLTTTTVYDTNGRAIQTWLPGDSNGTTPRTTVTTYYTASGSGSCVDAKRAGLVCQTAPGAQPATGSPLPTINYSYDQYGNVSTKTEAYSADGSITGSTPTRTTTTTYDAAGRPLTTAVTTANAPTGSTSLPAVTYGYDPQTGLPTTQTTGSGASQATLTSSYNTVGQAISYTDTTGNVATTGYDIDGRPIIQNDGKGTTVLTYNGSGEHRGLVTSEDIGAPSGTPSTFTATYNPAGGLASETYPNGLVASSAYDNAGHATALSYTKGGTAWMAFTATNGTGGRTVANSSTLAGTAYSNQTYAYDPAGRLTTVQDTAPGAGASGCVTRNYGFDTHSNRTSLTSYPAASGGACSSTTSATTTSYTYDGADRLTSDTAGSYTYDAFGRTTSAPAGDAAGVGSHAAITGAMSVNYYDNDLVAHQAQGTGTTAATIDYSLDPMQNRILTGTENDGSGLGTSTTIVTTNHYTDGSDSPAWTGVATTPNGGSTTNTWSRNIDGIDGNLAATADQAGNVVLQLTNLHGDICATAPDTTTATGVSGYWETTEYGTPRNAAAAPSTYGWVGGKKRSANALGGVTLMGVRLYNPGTGRFLSVDPVPGGNPNAYTYPVDPIKGYDLDGRFWGTFFKVATIAVGIGCVVSGPAVCAAATLAVGTASAIYKNKCVFCTATAVDVGASVVSAVAGFGASKLVGAAYKSAAASSAVYRGSYVTGTRISQYVVSNTFGYGVNLSSGLAYHAATSSIPRRR